MRARGSRSKPQVVAIAKLPGENLGRERLEILASQLGAKDGSWAMVLGRSEYQFSRVDRPSVSDTELEQSLRWLVPFKEVNPQDAAISWIPVPASPGKPQQVYVAACDKALVSSRAAAFRLAKLDLRVVDIREMAQRNIAAKISSSSVVCLLSIEESGLLMTISQGAELYLERFIREPILEAGGADDVSIKRIGIEIRRSIEFIKNTYPAIESVAIWLGPAPGILNMASRLSEELAMPVENLDLGSIFDWSTGSPMVDPRTQAEFFPLLGACLRL